MRNLGIGLVVMFVVGCGSAAGMKSEPAASPASPASGGAAPASDPGSSSVAAYGAPAAEAAAPTGGGMAAQPGAPGASPAPPPPPAPASRAPAKADAKSADARGPSPAASTTAPMPIARPEPPRLPQGGQLTAGVWDDNRNFDFFKPYAVRFKERNGSDFAMFSEQELANARAQTNAAQHTELDVQLVLDTTGSMGDELSYLQGEFDAIAAQVRTKFPNVTPRWSLVVYRDQGDEYVTRHFDFTADTARFRSSLRAQSAGGGGDTPEAVVEGLSSGLRQSWRGPSNVAKVAFWVADAPAHPGQGKVLANVIRDAKNRGVHIYPIASSDTDEAAEFQMRSAAQMTGGRYIFLTNDSGIGNDHAEPHIPCYNVTRLDHAIVRMIEVELSGRHVEAPSNQVVRAVGRPDKEGKCTLSSGMLVASY
jgi:von Willebrand factor type A domain-containing protein